MPTLPPIRSSATLPLTRTGTAGPYPDSNGKPLPNDPVDVGDREIIDVFTFPPIEETTSVTTLNRVQAPPPPEVNGNVPGYRSLLGFSFGEHTLQGFRVNRPFYQYVSGGGIYHYVYAFSHGTLNSITSVNLDGVAYGGSGTNPYVVTKPFGSIRVYNGQQTEVDNVLKGVIDYPATHEGFVIAVLSIKNGSLGASPPRLSITGQWESQIYDPRGATSTGYTNNAALCLRHYIVNALGGTMDDTASETVYDRCDVVIESSIRHPINMALRSEQSEDDWLRVLSSYASCWAILENGVWTLVPDAPKDPVGTLNGDNILSATWTTGGTPPPDNVEVKYRDLTTGDSKSAYAVPPGSGQDVLSINMPGFNNAGDAKRFAEVEWAKRLLREEKGTIVVAYEGIEYQMGDVVNVADPYSGIANKPYLITGAQERQDHYTLTVVEWQDAVFSDSFEVIPDITPSGQDPFDIDTVTIDNLAFTSTYQQDSDTASLHVAWDEPEFEHVAGYQVIAYNDTYAPEVEVFSDTFPGRSITNLTIPGVAANNTFRVEVIPYNELAIGVATSTAAFDITNPSAKYETAPSAPTNLSIIADGPNRQILLTFDPPSHPVDLFQYNVRMWYQPLGSGSWVSDTFELKAAGSNNEFRLTPSLSRTWTDSGGTPDKYRVYMRVQDKYLNESADSANSNEIDLYTDDQLADEVQNTSGVSGTTVADALDTLDAASGGGVNAYLKAKSNSSSASLDDTENDIVWASPVIELGTASTDISISGSEITINTAGTYEFTVTLRTDSSNRTELFIRTYIDTGSGYTQDTDEIVSDYVSRDTDQDTGSVTLISALTLDATDKVEFRGFGDTDGTCVILDPGTVLLINRLA